MSIASVGCALLCNFASGPATVLSNKLVFSAAGFNFPITLTAIHYVATWGTVRALAFYRVYEPPSIRLLVKADTGQPTHAVVALIVAWSLYNIASNTSLAKNSVATYQMVKLLMTPLAVLWDLMLYQKHPTSRQLLYLTLAVFGVSLCTTSGADISSAGLSVALVAVGFAVAQKGLTTHVVQYTKLKLSPLQLLDKCMPGMGLITLVSALALEDTHEILVYEPNLHRCWALLVSAASGALANISATWVLGATSPIAHILLGQLKTVLVLLGGYFFFDSQPNSRSLLGASLAVFAISLYAWSKLPSSTEMREATQASTSHVDSDESFDDEAVVTLHGKPRLKEEEGSAHDA